MLLVQEIPDELGRMPKCRAELGAAGLRQA